MARDRNQPDDAELRRDFLRFRARGEAAALARVFDALGPRLLLLAAHLCREPQAAEDLVQATFLDAMQSAATFDPDGELEAWLCAILRHRAVDLQRARARRPADHGVDLDRLAAAGSGPPEVSAAREHVERLRLAIDGLPALYREVAALRLVHGLEPIEIARALGRPAGTVRMQCQRAIEMLRRALPAGLAGALLPAASVRSWADLRAEVLAAAEGYAPAVVGGAFLSTVGLTMATKKVFAAIAVMLAAGAAVLWLGDRAAVPPATDTPPARAGAEARIAARDRDPARAAADLAPDPIAERRAVAGADPAPQVAVIRGRCVDEQGSALADVTAEIPNLWRFGDSDAVDFEPVRTQSGADGSFELVIDVPQKVDRADLRLRAAERCDCNGTVPGIAPGTRIELGDLVVPRGIRVRGRVVDTEGQAVARTSVRISTRSMHVERTIVGPEGSDLMETADDGSFGPSQLLAARPATTFFQVDGRRLARPHGRIAAAPGTDLAEVELVVETVGAVPAIAGRVVDARGTPLPAVSLRIGNPFNVSTSSDGDGTFRLEAPPLLPDAFGPDPAVEVEASSSRHVTTAVTARWGDEDLEIVLRPAPGLQVTVVAGETGEPVETFALDLLRESRSAHRLQHDVLRRLGQERHEGGQLLIDPAPGSYAVHVDPAPGPYAPSSFVSVTVGAAQRAELTVELWPSVERVLRLRNPDGGPVAGAEVELIDPLGAELGLGTEAFRYEEWDALSGGFTKLLTLQSRTTDAAGELVLRGPSRRALSLRLRGPGIALQVHGPVRLDDAGALELEAASGAVWEGAILPSELGARLHALSKPGPNARAEPNPFGIELADPQGRALRRYLEASAPYDAQGRFRLEGIPAGTWQVRVYAMGRRLGTGEIVATDGARIRRDLDLAAIWPCEVELQFFVDGEPPGERQVVLYGDRVKLPGETRAGDQRFVRTDADGRLQIAWFPGTLEADLRVDGAALWSAPLPVPAGGRVRHVVDLRTAAAVLTLRRPGGAPAADLEFELGRGPRSMRSGRTDAAGRYELGTRVAGRYTVRVRPAGWTAAAGRDLWVQVGAFDLPAGHSEIELTLDAPDRRNG